MLVVWGTHREVVEVKEDSEAELAGESGTLCFDPRAAGGAWLSFPALEEIRDLREPRLTNVRLVLRYRCG